MNTPPFSRCYSPIKEAKRHDKVYVKEIYEMCDLAYSHIYVAAYEKIEA